jgi:hypothetical protein
MTWPFSIDRTAAKALATYIRTYSIFKSEHLSINIKLTLYKSMNNGLCLSLLEACVRCCPLETAASAEMIPPSCRQLRQVHTGPRNANDTEIRYVHNYIRKLCGKQAEVIQNHLNPNVCANRLGETMHRKHKGLKHGDGQAYDSLGD